MPCSGTGCRAQNPRPPSRRTVVARSSDATTSAVGTALSVGTGVTVAEGTDSVGTASVGTARRYPTDSPIDLVGHTPPERPPATSSAAPIDLVGHTPPERP